jgi:hypothetical protein
MTDLISEEKIRLDALHIASRLLETEGAPGPTSANVVVEWAKIFESYIRGL